jgi:methylphosphotriester-DNA--protein-cysteine methyltransferase
MKKQITILTLLLLMLTSVMVAQTVYVTKTGKKFHSESCVHLSKSSIPISLEDAKAKGFGACKSCNPEAILKTAAKDTLQIVKKEEKNEKVAPR